MLSAVLRSDRAIQVSFGIIRVFVKLRQMASNDQQLARRIDELEKKYDGQFQIVFQAIRELIGSETVPPKRRIGFGGEQTRSVALTAGLVDVRDDENRSTFAAVLAEPAVRVLYGRWS